MRDEQVQDVIRALQHGLPITEHPYQCVADEVGVTETDILRTIDDCLQQGIFKRFATIVRHRKLGYVANAMVVWDIPDDLVDEIGTLLAKEPSIRLCYRRPRRLPVWPYNLFTMIHGQSRDWVLQELSAIRRKHQLEFPCDVLFSKRCFRQRGALYLPEAK